MYFLVQLDASAGFFNLAADQTFKLGLFRQVHLCPVSCLCHLSVYHVLDCHFIATTLCY